MNEREKKIQLNFETIDFVFRSEYVSDILNIILIDF